MTQEQKILARLREAGNHGVSNYELMKIAFQYPARVYALRHKGGYDIEAKHISGSEWRFTLIEKPTENLLDKIFDKPLEQVDKLTIKKEQVAPLQGHLFDEPPVPKKRMWL